MTKASDNDYPSLLLTEGTTPATPAASHFRLFFRSSDHLLCKVDSAGAVTVISGGSLADQGVITYLDGTVAAAPGTPAAGKLRLYAKTGKVLAVKDDAGLETVLGSGGSGTAHAACQGRLTLTTAVPVTTADVTAATTLYFTPFRGNLVGTYSGSAWSVNAFTEKSITLATLTAGLPYDVFIVDSTLALELVAWTNATTRATALAVQDGVFCKSGALTRRYLGTICIAATGQCEDSLLKRYVWNYYNRVDRKFKVIDATDSWTGAVLAWRPWDNSTANRVELVVGVSEDLVGLRFAGLGRHSAGATIGLSIGLDSTTASGADVVTGGLGNNIPETFYAEYQGYPGIGYHYLQLIERGFSSGTSTFWGDAGETTGVQSGAAGRIVG